MKLALADSVDHTLKKWPSLFVAVMVDDTQFQAVGKSQHVSQQLQRAIRLFTDHAGEVAGNVVSSKKLEIRTDVRSNKVHAEALARARGTWGEEGRGGGRLRLRRETWHGRQGHAGASTAVQG